MTGVRSFQMEFEFESAFDEMGKLEELKKKPVGEREKFTTSTFPIMHLICPPKILHNLCFLFLLGIIAVPREIENNA